MPEIGAPLLRFGRDLATEALALGRGGIALVENGDLIRIDIPARSINLLVAEEELERRRIALNEKYGPEWRPAYERPRTVSKALKAYAKMATSADKGAVRSIDHL